ncbi:PqqD family protein [Streptomyces sp. NPDC004126]|uniref:PqqD family protein n=1 Tax=Streptomyces sp. NPDC004126 TaxID=3390695 RepID=UPI003D00A7A9
MITDGWIPQRAYATYTRRSPTGMLLETYHDGYEINETGVFIWSRVGSGVTVGQIVEQVAEAYSVDTALAASAVHDFLTVLVERGFIEQAEGEADAAE